MWFRNSKTKGGGYAYALIQALYSNKLSKLT